MAVQPIKALFLDVGGVIVQIDWTQPFKYLQIHDPLECLQLANRLKSASFLHDYETGRISENEFLAHLVELTQEKYSKAQLLAAWKSLILKLVPGAERIFHEFKGKIPIYALSNINHTHFEQIFSDYPIFKQFDGFFASHQMGLRKPQPSIYLEATQLAGVAPTAALFIDDTEVNVTAAQGCGLHAGQSIDDVETTLQLIRQHTKKI
jgi:putative hydrolase of the HAD superfamily